MGLNDEGATSSTLSDRRWLIGIGVSVAFGLFGAVMALLSYAQSAKAHARPGAPAAVTPPPTATTAPREEGKSHGKGHARD